MKFGRTSRKIDDQIGEKHTGGRPKSPLLLVLALIVGTVATATVFVFLQIDEAGIAGFEMIDEAPLLPELAGRVDDVHGVKVQGPAETFSLIKHDQGWRLVERDGYPVPTARVVRFLEAVAGLNKNYGSTHGEPPYEYFGVAIAGAAATRSGTTISLLDRAGDPIAEITLGNSITVPEESRTRTLLTVRRSDDPRIWMVENDVETPGRTSDWLDQNLVDVPRDSIAEIATVLPEKPVVVVRRNGDGDLEIAKELSSAPDLEGPWVIETAATALERLRFVDVRTVAGIAELDTQPVHIEFKTDGGMSYEIELFEAEGGHWVTVAAANADGELTQDLTRFNDRHTPWAYRLAPLSFARLTALSNQLKD